MASDMEPSDGEEEDTRMFAGSDDDGDDAPPARAGFADSEDEDEDEERPANGQESDEGDEDEEEEEDVPGADDDEEEDEEPQAPVPKQKSISQYLGSVAASAKPAAAKRPATSGKAEAPRQSKEGAGKGKGKGKGGRAFAHSDDDDASDTDMPTLPGAGPKRKQLELGAVDPVEEHERLRQEAYANGAAGGGMERDGASEAAKEVAPKVASAVKSTVFIVKNDKGPVSKRFYAMSHEAVVHAPNFPVEDTYRVSPGDLVVARKERETVLSKWADENIKKMIKSTVICKVRVDGSGSGSGPGMTNLAAFLHVDPMGTQPQGYEELLEKVGVGETLDKPPAFLIMMDEKLVKRLYKFGKAELPSVYDPNRHGNVKYRVLNKLEEQATIDDHFKLATPSTVAKGRKSKRPADQMAAAASSNANGELRDGRDVPPEGEVAADALAWHACGFPNVKMAKIKTNGKEKLQLVETSKPNEFLLFRIE